MKILLAHCWQTGNTGDNAIWKNMMRRLREFYPDCKFVIASQLKTDWDVEQLKEFNPQYISIYWADLLQGIDVVISQGGGYMTKGGMREILKKFRKAQKLGIPTFFATESFVGPIPDDILLLAQDVFNKAKLVVARERKSFELLKSIGVKNVIMLPDQVFDVELEPYEGDFKEYPVKIGIRGYLADEEFKIEIARFADMVSETIGKVLFVPIGHGEARNDREVAKDISLLMRHECKIIEDEVSAGQLKTILSDGIFVSDRYHGIVYSASVGTPFLALTPDIDYKMDGLLELFDYPIGVFDKTIKAEKLFENIVKIYKDKEKYRKLLMDKLPEVKKKAKSVYNLIAEKINE